MIVFLGSPLLDIIANVDKNLLEKYDLKPDNTVRATAELERIFYDILEYNPIIQPGGSVTNTARILQWISRKSYPVVITGCIGIDEYGRMIKTKLTEEEIRCHLFELPDIGTGKVAVLLTDQNRSMVTHLGASKCFSLQCLDGELWEDIQKAEYFYISGFSLGTCFEVVPKIFQHIRHKNKTIIINLGASFLSKKYKDQMRFLFENADIVFGNETEYRSFFSSHSSEGKFTQELLENLDKLFSKQRPRLLIMTRGGQSVFVLHNGKQKEFQTLPIPKDKIVDTDGAGDAFVGGFLAQFIKNKDIPECVGCGMWAAKEIIQQRGCNFDKNKVYDS